MQEQFKFKIITGRGEEEKIEITPKKEPKFKLKSITVKHKEEAQPKKKEPIIKKTFKISKKTIKLSIGFLIIVLIIVGFYFLYKNVNTNSKLQLFSFFPKSKKQEVSLQSTSSEALLLLYQKFKEIKVKEEATTSTMTPLQIASPTEEESPEKEIEISTPTTPTTSTEIQTATFQEATKTEETTTTQITKIEKIEPASPKVEEIKEIKKEEIPAQKTKESIIFPSLSKFAIDLTELNEEGFKRAWLEAIKTQKEAGSIYEIEFKYNDTKVINELVRNYFIKPSFIEQKHSDEFKKILTDYKILFYYTYTRKYPILIFHLNNDSFAVTFMRLWDKETLLKDMYNLYLGLPKGKLVRNFTMTEKYGEIKYNIAYYDNDYKFIWTIYNNYLIFSTSLNAFKYVINLIK